MAVPVLKQMYRYWIVFLACVAGALVLAGCAPRKRPMPPSNNDLASAVKLNEDIQSYADRGDMQAVSAAAQLQKPLLMSAQAYINNIWMEATALTQRLNDLDDDLIGPAGWRWIYWILGIGLTVYVGAGVLAIFTGGFGQKLINALPLMNPWAKLREMRAVK